MLRDLWIGGVLGIGLYWWRTQAQRVEWSLQQTQGKTQQLQQQLDQAQQALTLALTQRTALETQVAELNQLATDRAIELIQLQAENSDLQAQVAELSQKRTRKKRTAKVTVTPESIPESSESSTESIPETTPEALPDSISTPETQLEPAISAPFALDFGLIQAKQVESAAATQLLQSVFIEEQRAPAAAFPVLQGLDIAHTTFLQTLQQQTLWSREDLVQVAQQLDLLLDGALELINEAAFDRCDEPLTEGEDPLEINPTVLQELLS